MSSVVISSCHNECVLPIREQLWLIGYGAGLIPSSPGFKCHCHPYVLGDVIVCHITLSLQQHLTNIIIKDKLFTICHNLR